MKKLLLLLISLISLNSYAVAAGNATKTSLTEQLQTTLQKQANSIIKKYLPNDTIDTISAWNTLEEIIHRATKI